METTIYESHKKVKRLAMTRLDYDAYRGWELPSNENGDDEGYLVEYLDGGEPNDHRHEGYISWSPKAQFDNGYTAIEDDFSGQLIKEADELGEKFAELSAFIESDAFAELNILNTELLLDQLRRMRQYLDILNQRLAPYLSC